MKPKVWSPEVPRLKGKKNNKNINSQQQYKVEETLQDFPYEVEIKQV